MNCLNVNSSFTCRCYQECQNSLEMAITVLSNTMGGSGGFRGHDAAASSHMTAEGGRRPGDDVMSPIPVVDQATGTQHSEKKEYLDNKKILDRNQGCIQKMGHTQTFKM